MWVNENRHLGRNWCSSAFEYDRIRLG